MAAPWTKQPLASCTLAAPCRACSGLQAAAETSSQYVASATDLPRTYLLEAALSSAQGLTLVPGGSPKQRSQLRYKSVEEYPLLTADRLKANVDRLLAHLLIGCSSLQSAAHRLLISLQIAVS